MSVVEGPVPAAETGRASNRTLDIISRTIYRGLDVETLSQAGCDRRGEGAAGTVGMAGRDPRALPDPGTAARNEDIGHGFPGEMATLDQHSAAPEPEQGLAGGSHL